MGRQHEIVQSYLYFESIHCTLKEGTYRFLTPQAVEVIYFFPLPSIRYAASPWEVDNSPASDTS